MKKHINVVAAIIMDNEKILCVQRGSNKFKYISHKYEFPGGKIEDYENDEEALKREILEELSIEIDNIEFFETVFYEYPDFKLTMECYKCTTRSRNLKLSEHINYKWLEKQELNSLDWAEADLPIVKKLNEINE